LSRIERGRFGALKSDSTPISLEMPVASQDTFTSHIDPKIFLTFLLTPYLYTFSLYENASLIIFSAETEYISTRY
jgi:hypothetical protein